MATSPTFPALPDNPELIQRSEGSWLELSPGTLSQRVDIGSSEYAFILGLLESNEQATIDEGDYIELSQDIDVTESSYLDFPINVIGRDNVWSAQVYIDGTLFVEKQIDEDRESSWNDFIVPVEHLTGTVTVTVRLYLVS